MWIYLAILVKYVKQKNWIRIFIKNSFQLPKMKNMEINWNVISIYGEIEIINRGFE